jgi:hypothetical protein
MDYLLLVVGILSAGSLYYIFLIVRCIKELNDSKNRVQRLN